MSKPQFSNRDYGYQPNMAKDLLDMESVVTTEGMRMAGAIEKHSEFMEPNRQSYESMEYNYPYPPFTMPPASWVGPGVGWPPTTQDTDYTPRVFRCIGSYCCCGGNLVDTVDITCTYPIVAGPWVVNGDGTTCEVSGNQKGNKEVSVCINPCGDGSCPPEIWCKIKAPEQTRTRGGKKEKLPAMVMDQQVFMVGKAGCPTCPVTSACCTGVSISGQPQMNVGTSQTLTVLNPVPGCSYEFRKTTSAGRLTKVSNTAAVFTAPDSNPGCVNNATIYLYDITRCVVCTSITIAITNPAVTGVAYRKRVCGCGGMACTSYDYSDNWGCDGVMYPQTGTCLSAPWCGCDHSGTKYSQSHMEPGWNPYPVGDIRTAEMKAQGCCPINPL